MVTRSGARPALFSAIMVGVLLLGAPASAEAQPTTEPSGGGAGAGPAGGSGPGSEEKKPASNNPTAGYAYGDRPTASRQATHARYRRTGPVVNTPGFEQMEDGGSRLFVQLSQPVPVEERKAADTITYVLKGASPRVWNNTNALVTVHFNTPVSRARLVPHGQDLHFVIELRAAATPTWKMSEATDKTATLMIDFPKGDFLTPVIGEAASGEAAPARGKGRKHAPGRGTPKHGKTPQSAPPKPKP